MILLVETWLDDSVTDSMLVYDRPYQIVRRDRGSFAGGLAFIVKNNISFKLVSISTVVEAISFDLGPETARVILGYIPNNTDRDVINNMSLFIRSNMSSRLPNIVLGDYNMSSIDWVNSKCNTAPQQCFFDCITNLGLKQLVQKPTRGNNILDLVMVDNDREVFDVDVLEHFGNSDHNIVVFCVASEGPLVSSKPPERYKRVLNSSLLHGVLRVIDWSSELNGIEDTETLHQTFQSRLSEAVNFCSTSKCLKQSGRVAYPKHIRNLVSKKKRLWRTFKNNKNQESKLAYLTCSKKLTHEIKTFEINSEQNIIAEGNLSALYRHVKRKTGLSRDIPPLHSNQGLLTENKAKAEILNEVFSSNFTIDNNVLPAVKPHTSSTFTSVKFAASEIENVLASFKNSHAVGPDGFSAAFYKEFSYELSKPLFKILDTSMKTGQLPSSWKKGVVTPIYKKGNAADPKNYRPISLTCVPCRVLERIIRDQLTQYLKQHNLLDPNQFGFLPGRSTTLQLLKCVNDWTLSLESGSPTDVILIDFAKAFDSVSHQKLVAKLTSFGIGGNVLTWISSFLSNRTQHVSVCSTISDEKPVTSGVPQGSVMGPLLFLLYVSDLQANKTTQAKMPKFADDVELYRVVENVDHHVKLSTALNDLVTWSEEWQLQIAVQKCSVFHIGSKNLHLDYALSGNTLDHVTEIKNLGVWFSSNMKSSSHCNHIVKTARQRAAMIKRCFVSKDRKTLFWAFCVYVRPILEYASPVWSPYLVKDIDLVESVQRHFTKYLPGLKEKPYSKRLEILKADSLELRRLKFDLVLTYSLLHGLCNIDYTTFFSLRTGGKTRGHPLKLIVQPILRDCRKFFFSHRVVNVWNSLPAHVVISPSVKAFKTNLAQAKLAQYVKWA